MPRHRVMGLDISANRIAYAICDSVSFMDSMLFRRCDWHGLPSFVEDVSDHIKGKRSFWRMPAICLEINLHPDVTHKGKLSPTKVKAYMRSRWVEGAIIAACADEEPAILKKLKGGYYEIPPDRSWFAIQASGGKHAKEMRRERMFQIYGMFIAGKTQDEVDALAISHECAVALTVGIKEGSRAT